MHRRLLLALPAAVLLARPARAAPDASAAAAFINKLLTNVLAVINAAPPDMTAKLQALVDSAVDVGGIARFCVGRFWRTATPQQQTDYQGLFRKVLLNNILGRIGEYKGTSFEMGGTTPRDDTIAVATTVNRPNNAPNKVEWLIGDAGGPKVVDVIAEGTSLRLTQRSDYLAFIGRNNNNLQALIDAMRQQATG